MAVEGVVMAVVTVEAEAMMEGAWVAPGASEVVAPAVASAAVFAAVAAKAEEGPEALMEEMEAVAEATVRLVDSAVVTAVAVTVQRQSRG